MNLQRMLIGTMAALAVAACAGIAPVSDRDGILTAADGKTLYVFTKDSPGKSNCNGACASTWPPFLASEGARNAGAFTVIVRDDGARQWAHNGRPLYLYAADTRPGETKGEGQGGAWFVVKAANPVRQSDGGGY